MFHGRRAVFAGNGTPSIDLPLENIRRSLLMEIDKQVSDTARMGLYNEKKVLPECRMISAASILRRWEIRIRFPMQSKNASSLRSMIS